MTPKKFNNLKVGDLLKIQKDHVSSAVSFIRSANMMSVFDVLPHPDSVFVIVDVRSIERIDTVPTKITSVRAHYTSGLGAIGHAIITPDFAYGFELVE